jgi:hypothetical protein
MTTITDKVEFTNPNIVKFFNKYSNTPAFFTSCEKLLESFCVSTDNMLQNYTSKTTHNTTINGSTNSTLAYSSFDPLPDQLLPSQKNQWGIDKKPIDPTELPTELPKKYQNTIADPAFWDKLNQLSPEERDAKLRELDETLPPRKYKLRFRGCTIDECIGNCDSLSPTP